MGQGSVLPESPAARQPRTWFARALVVAGLLSLFPVSAGLLGRHLRARNELQAGHEALARFDLARAQEHLDAYLELRPGDTAARLLAAQTARRRGAPEEADYHLAAYEKLQGSGPASALERTLQLAQEGDLAGTERLLQARLKEGGPETPLILEALTQGHLRTMHVPEARRYVEPLVRRQPQNPLALLWRGRIREFGHHDEEALQDYQRALELCPDLDEARLRAADALDRIGRVGEAADCYETLLQRQPGNAAVTLRLARCRYDLHDVAGARTLLDGLLAEQPENVQALVERSRLAVKEGESGRAEIWLRRAVQRAPRERDAWYILHLCLEQQGKKAEDEQCLARLKQIEIETSHVSALIRRVSTAPHDPSLRYDVAVALLRVGDGQQGVRWLLSALQEDPGYTPARQALAAYRGRDGQGIRLPDADGPLAGVPQEPGRSAKETESP